MNRILLAGLLLALPFPAVRSIVPGYLEVPTTSTATADVTTASMALYVDPTGRDSNACTASGTNACLTIKGALNKIPARVRHPVDISVAAGSYGGFHIPSIDIDGSAAPTTGAYVYVHGTMGVSTITGLQTGTVTSATAGSASTTSGATMTKTAAGWTVSALKGKWVYISAGLGSAQYRVIADNTATVLTLVGAWTAPDATSTFNIVEPTSIITSTVNSPASPLNAAGLAACIVVSGPRGQARPANVLVEGFKCSATSAVGIRQYGGVAYYRYIWFGSTTGLAGIVYGRNNTEATLDDSYFAPTGSGGTFYTGTDGSLLTLTRNVLSYNGFLTQITLNSTLVSTTNSYTSLGYTLSRSSGGLMWFTGDVFDGTSNSSGIGFNTVGTSAVTPSTTTIALNACSVSNYTTAFKIDGAAQLWCKTCSGSGNTTVFNATKGGHVQVDSGSTITGTTEISYDGTASDLATLRAASPKVLGNTSYGTKIYE